MEPESVSPEESEWIDDQLETAAGDLASFLSQAARLLGGACMELGLVLAPFLDQGVLTGLELVRLSSSRVMIVLRVRNGVVRTVLLDLTTALDADTLARTAARLNACLAGLTLNEIRLTLADRLNTDAFRNDEIVARLIGYGPSLFRFAGESLLYVGGAGNMASQPEFRSPETLEWLLRMIEERSDLSTLLEDRRSRSGVHITIGKENSGPLSATSIVTIRYAQGDLSGTLGVMGPTRMKYRRVVGVLQQVAGRFHSRLIA
jgi:heat-inducible transcriptional repressor